MCHVTMCVNPEHLRLATLSINSADQRNRPLVDQWCGRGHQKVQGNSGAYWCNTCRNQRERDKRRKRRSLA